MTTDFEIAIRVQNLSKCYQIYDNPGDRLKQFIVPRIKRLLGKTHIPYFREFWALKDVSFEVKRGETVGIIGRNGSGKSTLLQIICGTLTPTGGTVQTNGRIAALLELGSGFNPEFTGRENVYLNAAVLGLTQEEVDARFDKIAAFADIGQFMEQPVKTYSSGMMVRLAFAVIAHVDADILIVDEALSVGDVFFNQKCMRFLRAFMENGTILFVSHDTSAVNNLCTSAVWLDAGKVLSIGDAKGICEDYLAYFYKKSNELHIGESESEGSFIQAIPNQKASSDVLRRVLKKADLDYRYPQLKKSNIANHLEIFPFTESIKEFGTGNAKIVLTTLKSETTKNITFVNGGEEVELTIVAEVTTEISKPIIGFIVRDRLGQNLFGENTYVERQLSDDSRVLRKYCTVTFKFNMPTMPIGDYSVSAAVASGTQEEHVVHCWRHDVLVFRSTSTSVSTGLLGIPMHDIKIDIYE